MSTIRMSAVAGKFYPADSSDLKELIRSFLHRADPSGTTPKAIIVPHAGYVYSGPVAGTAYAQLALARGRIERVVLMGPSHFVPVKGLATTSASAISTPLGVVPVDVETMDGLLRFPQVTVSDEAHSREHSLDVHLPYLQEVLNDFRLVPLVVGAASADQVAEVLESLWDGPETLIAISSDLSHFHNYDDAQQIDRQTTQLIEELRGSDLKGNMACGFRAIGGLLQVAQARGLKVRTLDLRNSGDTAGDRERVVGYGAYVVEA